MLLNESAGYPTKSLAPNTEEERKVKKSEYRLAENGAKIWPLEKPAAAKVELSRVYLEDNNNN